MHFEVPKSKSLREFGGEYLMIVISIATALALEHLVQTQHHKQLAQEAAERMQVELRSTLTEVDQVVAHNKAQIDIANALRVDVLKDIEAKVPELKAMQKFHDAAKGTFTVSLHIPSYKHEAWDVAVANQSASWLKPAELQRYSSAYGAIHDSQQLSSVGMNFAGGPEMLKTLSDLEMHSATPRDVYYLLKRLVFSYEQINGSLADLREKLVKAVPPAEAAKS
jgi:hypothetical protein